MDLYRRIAAIRTDEDASDLLDEMLDRYGEAPKSVLALLDVALLRSAAAKAGVSDISQKGSLLRLQLGVFHPQALVAVCGHAKYRQRLTLAAGRSCPHPEAQARGGCAGGRPGPGGGPEAGRGGGRGRDPVSFIMFLPCPA
ncbi:MAG: TRCF domain-containing protein [Dysosmobacter welbionis]